MIKVDLSVGVEDHDDKLILSKIKESEFVANGWEYDQEDLSKLHLLAHKKEEEEKLRENGVRYALSHLKYPEGVSKEVIEDFKNSIVKQYKEFYDENKVDINNIPPIGTCEFSLHKTDRDRVYKIITTEDIGKLQYIKKSYGYFFIIKDLMQENGYIVYRYTERNHESVYDMYIDDERGSIKQNIGDVVLVLADDDRTFWGYKDELIGSYVNFKPL